MPKCTVFAGIPLPSSFPNVGNSEVPDPNGCHAWVKRTHHSIGLANAFAGFAGLRQPAVEAG